MYISCKVDKLPIFENKYEQHITLMYDKSNHEANLPDFQSGYAKVIGYDYLGPEQDALVLLLKSDYLMDYYDQLVDLGYTHSYPDLKLHTTIQYDIKDSIKPFYEVVASTMVGKEIYFHTITKEPIKESK